MKYAANYEVSLALQESSVRQYFFRVMVRSKLWRFLVIAALLILAFLLAEGYRPWVAGAAAFIFLLLAVLWTVAYFRVLRQARTGLDLLEHPRIGILLDDDGVVYESSTGTRRHLWNKVRRIEESKDFIILMHGELPLLSLPKSAFSEEALAFIRQKSWIERKD